MCSIVDGIYPVAIGRISVCPRDAFGQDSLTSLWRWCSVPRCMRYRAFDGYAEHAEPTKTSEKRALYEYPLRAERGAPTATLLKCPLPITHHTPLHCFFWRQTPSSLAPCSPLFILSSASWSIGLTRQLSDPSSMRMRVPGKPPTRVTGSPSHVHTPTS